MNRCKFLLSTFAVLALGSLAHASVLAYDAFGYNAGRIRGDNGGTGWAKAWRGAPDSLAAAMDTPMTYTFPTGEVADGGLNALALDSRPERDNNFDNGLRRKLAQPFSGDVVYASFLFRNDSSAVGADTCQMWLGGYKGPKFGMVGSSGAEGSDDFGASVGKRSDDGAFTGDLTLGQTYLIVARITKTTSGAKKTYNQIEMWINPSIDDQDTPDMTASLGKGTVAKFSTIGFCDTQNRTDLMFIDEVTLGTTWADVIPPPTAPPIPEPVTAALLLVGGVGMLSRKRRGH